MIIKINVIKITIKILNNNDNNNNNNIIQNTKFKMYKIRKKEVFYINIVILSN